MLSPTRRALEDFDNQHDFERLSADVLNALGYRGVEPMAPGGGRDGGSDIRFQDGDEPGRAFVTLDKKIRAKFQRDLEKQDRGEGLIALFCNVDISPPLKLEMAMESGARGYRLEVFDVERLRSLFDSSLKELRRRYLHIDDDIATQLRASAKKLLRFPAAVPDNPHPPTILEGIFVNHLPRRFFDLLMNFDEGVVQELPAVGQDLHKYMTTYYAFRTRLSEQEDQLFLAIGKVARSELPGAWRIYLRYVLMRFAGASPEQISGWGNFLNYGITWADAERVFSDLSKDPVLSEPMAKLLEAHDQLIRDLESISARIAG